MHGDVSRRPVSSVVPTQQEGLMSEADLARRLARLEAIEEIKQLKARYCAYCDDDYNPDGIANLFIENGIWEGERFGHHVGRDQIRTFFQGVSGEITFAAHLVVNSIIDVKDADHATGKWRLIMPATVVTEGGKEAKWLIAAYSESYVRVAGTWMFEEMRTHVNFFEPHQGSWAESAIL
jgi:hypothetical protein